MLHYHVSQLDCAHKIIIVDSVSLVDDASVSIRELTNPSTHHFKDHDIMYIDKKGQLIDLNHMRGRGVDRVEPLCIGGNIMVVDYVNEPFCEADVTKFMNKLIKK